MMTNRKLYLEESYASIIDLPSHQAPTHRGSVGVIFGSTVRSAYSLVHSEPSMNPRAGPRIRTPMVIAVTEESNK
jgi:hypothetical protein